MLFKPKTLTTLFFLFTISQLNQTKQVTKINTLIRKKKMALCFMFKNKQSLQIFIINTGRNYSPG